MHDQSSDYHDDIKDLYYMSNITAADSLYQVVLLLAFYLFIDWDLLNVLRPPFCALIHG